MGLTTGDGLVDMRMYEPPMQMRQPMVSGVPVDTVGNGIANAMGYDTNGDGQIDSLDTTGDGMIDTRLYPTSYY